jgi:chemotaxis response regulator CheB
MDEISRIRVLSVDDHPLMREGIGVVIRSQPDMTLVAGAASGRQAIERFKDCAPDVTLMDRRLPDMS